MFLAITAHEFRLRVFYSVLVIFAGTLGLQLLLYSFVGISGCSGNPGACGALGAVGLIFGIKLIFFAAGLIYALAAFKRIQLGFSPLWLIFVLAALWEGLNSFSDNLFLISQLGIARSIPLIFLSLLSNAFPLIVLTLILSIEFESKSKMENGILEVKISGNIPVGKIYSYTAFLISIFTLFGILGFSFQSGAVNLEAFAPISLIAQLFSGCLSLLHGLAGCWLVMILLPDNEVPNFEIPQSQSINPANNSRQQMFGRRKH
jgi:hypothetical protein